MKIFLKLFLSLVTLFISFYPGCGKTGDQINSKKMGDSTFNKLADEYISGYLKWRPQSGVGLGLHEYDGKITDYSPGSITVELARLRKYQHDLVSLDTSILSSKTFYDYKILLNAINKEIFDFEVTNSYKNNPMSYAGVFDVNIYIKRNFAPLKDRVKSIISILKEAPKVYTDAKKNLADSLPGPFIKTAILIAKGTADFLGKDMLVALEDLKNDSLMKELEPVNKKAIEEINNYALYLEKEKLPKANNNYSLGRENYKKMLSGEMVNMEPEKILEIGMKHLHEEQKLFEETAKKIDPNKKAVDVFKEIQQDHPTPATLIPDTKKNIEAIRQFLIDKKVITIPSDVRVKVEETPRYARATSFASMDSPGPFETKATEAYYYVTPVENNWTEKQKNEWLTAFNYYTTDIVSIHESYPGHFIQFLHLNSSSASKVQKIFGSYAFTEGWAHYTERMMLEEGFGTDKDSITAAKYKLAQLDESLLRLCRLCVSVKMHCEGMSVEEAAKFFMDNCYYERKPAEQEAIRGTYDPGYLNYSLGKFMILKLRDDYKEQEGSEYSLLKFHDAMTNNGMPPIPMLREKLLKDKNLWAEIL